MYILQTLNICPRGARLDMQFMHGNLAQELHVEEKLGVKKIETDVVGPKKEIDRIKSDFTGSGRGVGLIIHHGWISWP